MEDRLGNPLYYNATGRKSAIKLAMATITGIIVVASWYSYPFISKLMIEQEGSSHGSNVVFWPSFIIGTIVYWMMGGLIASMSGHEQRSAAIKHRFFWPVTAIIAWRNGPEPA